MKLLILHIIFIVMLNSANLIAAENIDPGIIEKLRVTYYSGVENEDYIDSLKTIITKNFGENISRYPALILAYHAGIEALKSKHSFWPFTKMTYLNDSMDIFEKAITNEPENLEIRFMRYSILYFVPGILGYESEEQNDLEKVYQLLLNQNYSVVDFGLQKGMAEFILQSGSLNETELNKLYRIFGSKNGDE
ncbi:MAG: hypothetical protein JW995_05780 [Melioribacteraceae bacterium]|nr:hypothetical protein [Melioribacteraceae bacterium]